MNIKYFIFLLASSLPCTAMDPDSLNNDEPLIIAELGEQDLFPLVTQIITDLAAEEADLYNSSSNLLHLKKVACLNDQCQKLFRSNIEMQNHFARNHQRRKPFKCSKCTNRYSTQSSLNLHTKRTHAKRKYSCKYCDSDFAIHGDLVQHIKRHKEFSIKNENL